MNFKMENTSNISKMDKQTVKARTDSIFRLKAIVWAMFLSTIFNLIYSIMVFFMFDSTCYPQRISQFANSWFTLIDRVVSYFIWFYPIMYLFWPTKRHQVQVKRIQ